MKDILKEAREILESYGWKTEELVDEKKCYEGISGACKNSREG